METILIATSNAGKVREMEKAFEGLPVRLVPLSRLHEVLPDAPEVGEPVEDGATFLENARIKARYYREKTGLSALADDSGLAVDALDGAPGVYSARYAGVLVLALADGRELTAEGVCRGFIRPVPRGTGGFGYDPHFYLPDGKAMAELSLAEKHAVSHRGAALREMKELVAGIL